MTDQGLGLPIDYFGRPAPDDGPCSPEVIHAAAGGSENASNNLVLPVSEYFGGDVRVGDLLVLVLAWHEDVQGLPPGWEVASVRVDVGVWVLTAVATPELLLESELVFDAWPDEVPRQHLVSSFLVRGVGAGKDWVDAFVADSSGDVWFGEEGGVALITSLGAPLGGLPAGVSAGAEWGGVVGSGFERFVGDGEWRWLGDPSPEFALFSVVMTGNCEEYVDPGGGVS